MKTIRTTLLIVMATFGLLASLTVSTSATGLAGIAYNGNATGSLTPTPAATNTSPVVEGDTVSLKANFPSSEKNKTITFFEETSPGSNDYASFGTAKANSSGDATLSNHVVDATQRVFGQSGTNETGLVTLTAVPADAAGHVDPITGNGKTVTAQFDNPAPGTATKLQIQRIVTTETNEVNSTNLLNPADTTAGPWVTIASSTQNATGGTSFSVPSPYPYRVAHKYRALSGPTRTPPVSFGTGQVTPKNSGLSAVYFNTNENASVNTRTHYFEGEFAMTADTKGLGCTDVSTMGNSVMKGRGNYSWSFPRKSFTLKLASKKNLCGMGSDKKWALVSDDYDKSLMRNSLAGYIGSKFNNMAWTPKSTPVDLYVNGSYRGNYLLIERISIKKSAKLNDANPDKRETARVDIPELKAGDGDKDCTGAVQAIGQTANALHPNNLDPCKTGGYILEWDFRKGADYNANLGSDSGYVGVKDPENDLDRDGHVTHAGISSQQKSYISSYLNTVDTTLRGSNFKDDTDGWKKYIDEASAVDYYIAMEYMKPIDGNMWASVYMYKQRDSSAGANDGKLYFGPMWDFDLSSGSANRAGNSVSSSGFYLKNSLGISAMQSSKTWFNRLNEDPDFRAAVKARWDAVKGSLDTNGFLDNEKSIISTSASQTYSSFSHSSRISSVQVIKSNWDADVSYLKSWASSRKSWLSGGSGF